MRLIDADILPLDIEREDIDNAPTVDAGPVVHAEWHFDSGCGRVKHYRCSKCGRTVCTFGNRPLLEEFPYCHCGALMSLPAVEKPVEGVEK